MASAIQELEAFTKEALSRGFSRSDIEQIVLKAGWSPEQVKSALGAFADLDFAVPVPRPRSSLSAARRFYIWCCSATLYFGGFNLGSLLFDFIDQAFPISRILDTTGTIRKAGRRGPHRLLAAVPFPVALYRPGNSPKIRPNGFRPSGAG
ncbi:MAG: hypothetical protein WDO70_02370 [Alphaproteobacteria bacterium]